MGVPWVVQVLTLRSGLVVAVLTVVAAAIAVPGVQRFRRRLLRSLRGPDAAELGLRTVSGRLPGIPRRWHSGIAVLDASGSLRWEAHEEPLRLWLLDTPPRRPRWYELSTLNPGASVHAVTTGTGWTGEVAVLPQDLVLLRHLPSFPGGAAGMPDLGGLNGTGGVARQ